MGGTKPPARTTEYPLQFSAASWRSGTRRDCNHQPRSSLRYREGDGDGKRTSPEAAHLRLWSKSHDPLLDGSAGGRGGRAGGGVERRAVGCCRLSGGVAIYRGVGVMLLRRQSPDLDAGEGQRGIASSNWARDRVGFGIWSGGAARSEREGIDSGEWG